MIKVANLLIIVSIGISLIKAPQPFSATSIEQRAESVGLSVEEFVLMSSVVEAESNRQAPEDGVLTTEGRVYIALTIINRVNNEVFPDTITGVLTQAGQFSTVRNGQSVTQRTYYSDAAVVEAWEWIQSGEEVQEVYFFNCRGYFSSRTAVGEFGGNYFSGF